MMLRTWNIRWDGGTAKITFPATDSLMWDTVEALINSQLWYSSYWAKD